MFYKISNLIQSNGTADYKGFDISKIVPGSQHYDIGEDNACVIQSDERIVHVDILELSEEVYNGYRAHVTQVVNPMDEMQAKIDSMQEAIDFLIMNGGA